MFAGIGARIAASALMQSKFGRFLKAVPRWVWIVLAAALVIFLAVRWHNGRIEDLKTTSFNAGYAQAVADGKKGVVKVEQRSTAIATEIRSKTDEKIRDNGRHADTLRVRGPGAAACLDPRLSSGTGGRQPTGGGSGPSLAGLPDEKRTELVAVPFADAVNRAEVDDANRIEVLAWREWHKRLTAEWDRYRADLDKRDSR